MFLIIILFISLPSFAQKKEKVLPLLDQIDSHMSVLEAKLSAIGSTTNADTQKKLYTEYFQELDNHMNLMSQMANSERSLGLKSTKRRLQYRINTLLSHIKSTVSQLKTVPNQISSN